MESAKARDQPRKFYSIEPQDDGTVNVYLAPDAIVRNTEMGIRECGTTLLIVHGVIPWDGLEEDVRARYNAWCASAEMVGI